MLSTMSKSLAWLYRDCATTYRCPCATGIFPVDASREFPSVKVADGRDDGLRGLRPGDQQLGARRGRQVEGGREKVDGFVDSSEE